MKNRILFLFCVALLLASCKKQAPEKETPASPVASTTVTTVKYADGFSLQHFKNYTLLEVSEAFPEANQIFRYALIPAATATQEKDSSEEAQLIKLLRDQGVDAIIKTPISKVVVTSTTHIPSLEMLGVIETLKGFPNLAYISSTLARKRIEQDSILELGQNESLNTELAIELQPDAVITFGVAGENKSVNSLQRAGIPVLYNGDWVEKNPLGKAEWIKFFGALYNKEQEADSIFKHIEQSYAATQRLLANITTRPTVLSGAMYRDVWYLPKGDSWQAKVLADAGGAYLWADTEGTGSSALSVESVLEKAQRAHYWIAPAQYTSYAKLKSDNPVYAQFEAFKNKKVYTFAKATGAAGGLLYYELAPNRPDLVLRDLAKILHPERIPAAFTFFSPLDE